MMLEGNSEDISLAYSLMFARVSGRIQVVHLLQPLRMELQMCYGK